MRQPTFYTLASILVIFLNAACSAKATPPIPTAHTLNTLSATQPPSTTATPTLPASATPKPTKTRASPTPTETPYPTDTPVVINADRRIPVVDVGEWRSEIYDGLNFGSVWKRPHTLAFENDQGQIQRVDPETGAVISVEDAPPPDTSETFSSSGEFQVVCGSSDIKMLHLPDQTLVAEAALVIEYCPYVTWASDGSAAALVTEGGEVYVWRTDGSAPKLIGTAISWTIPWWSPDDSQIMVLDQAIDPEYPSIMSFSIVYPDGRPMFKTGTEIDAGNHWEMGLEWVTDITIRNSQWGPALSIDDYYDARSGRFIIRNEYADSGRAAALSPDGRWLVLEGSPTDANWEQRWGSDFGLDEADTTAVAPPTATPGNPPYGLMACDLETLRQCPMLAQRLPAREGYQSGSDSLKFLDWNNLSSRLYLIHFPVGAGYYGLPTGLLALFPNIGYIEQILPDVAYGLESPDLEHIFLVTAKTIGENMATGLQAAIYKLDGTPVTAPQPLSDQLEYETLNEFDQYDHSYPDLVNARWSRDGSRLVYLNPAGELWLMDTAGQATLLASGLPYEAMHPYIRFSWSPDDQYLLIYGFGAWVVKLVP